MIPTVSPSNPFGRRQSSRCGAALIVVLSSLMLLSMITLAFLSSVRNELQSSKSYYDNTSSRILTDMATNVVMSQIRKATNESGNSWASQPGMIRTFDTNGKLAHAFKLYSSQTMVTSEVDQAAEAASLTGWDSKPALFTDLNEPSSAGRYPILDPASMDSNAADGSSLADPSSAVSSVTSVDQFTLNSPPVGSGSGANPAPMPASWIYVLRDGTLVAPSGSGSVANVTGASESNPVIGRMAFWTDDETCKINVNTAGYGANYGLTPASNSSSWGSTFWDVPHYNSDADRSFASCQPYEGEFQRYSGHPGTVSLRGVFPSLSSSDLFKMLPRMQQGGSLNGTVDFTTGTSVATKSNRLYPSIDEIAFSTDVDGTVRKTNAISLAKIDATRFFLTAHGRSPELNLFGLPRVSMWPIHTQTDHQTAVDKLIAFASTTGTNPFYFTREQASSLTNDVNLPRNVSLLNYLDKLTSTKIPGFGGTFSTKYSSDRQQILTEIFDYIRCTNLNDPQLSPSGNDFAHPLNPNGTAYGLGQAAPTYYATWNTKGFGGRFYIPNEISLQFVAVGKGDSAAPVKIPDDHWNYAKVDHSLLSSQTPPVGQTAVQAFLLINFLNPGMGMTSVVKTNSTGATGKYTEAFWVSVEVLSGMTLKSATGDDVPLLSGSAISAGPSNAAGTGGELKRGPRVFQLSAYWLQVDRLLGTSGASSYTKYNPFYSKIIPVKTSEKLGFSGGTIRIKMYGGQPGYPNTPPTNNSSLISTYDIAFPPLTHISVPSPNWGSNTGMGVGSSADRWAPTTDMFAKPLFKTEDTIQSMVLSNGDIRLLLQAPATATGTAVFIPHSKYDMTQQAHSMTSARRNSLLVQYGGATAPGNLVKGVSTLSANPQMVPASVDGVTGVAGSGDWDNGVSILPDGPWINQPDEGDTYISTAALPYFNADDASAQNTAFYAPNKMVPSPGMLGSLSTGVISGKPWQTLLFRPAPPYAHPGANSPADHLLLDLFWMPVAQPYALSDPFSSAGKINLNQQIIPYTYIHRYTALRAAFAGERIAVMDKSLAGNYKGTDAAHASSMSHSDKGCRQPLNLDEVNGTMRQIVARFNSGDIFRSASEICSVYLVPQTYSWSTDTDAQTSWYGDEFALVGDNVRERPYADLYGKLTTKSNTYQIHYRVQSLQKRAASNPVIWEEGKDSITGEKRGSTLIERYLDPADTSLKDATTLTPGADSFESSYKFRTIGGSSFHP